MKRSISWTGSCMLTIALLLFSACSSEPAKPPKSTKTIVVISNTASHFWKVVQEGCEKADAELADVDVIFKMASGSSVKDQEKYINEALLKDDADGIAISPIEPTEMKGILEKVAAKKTLITLDSDAPASSRKLYVGADNRAAGKQAGELLKKALPKGGKVMVFVGKRLENSAERLAGLREAVKDTKIEILDLMLDNNDVIKAKDNASEAMTKYPDLAGMVGLWSYNGPAILLAVKNGGKAGKIKIVAFDDEADTLAGIKEGNIFGTVAQQPFEFGYESVQRLAKILKDDKSAIPEGKKLFIPTVVVTRENVDEYKGKLDKLLAAAK